MRSSSGSLIDQLKAEGYALYLNKPAEVLTLDQRNYDKMNIRGKITYLSIDLETNLATYFRENPDAYIMDLETEKNLLDVPFRNSEIYTSIQYGSAENVGNNIPKIGSYFSEGIQINGYVPGVIKIHYIPDPQQ